MTKPNMKRAATANSFLKTNNCIGSSGVRRPNCNSQWKGPAGPHGIVMALQLPIVNKGKSSLWEQVGGSLEKETHIKDMHEFAMTILLYLAVAGVVPPWEQPCGDENNRGGAAANGSAGSEDEDDDYTDTVFGTSGDKCKIWVQLLFTENGDTWGYRIWFFGPIDREGGMSFDANVAIKKVMDYTRKVGDGATMKAMGNMFEKSLRGDSRHYQGLLYYMLHAYLTTDIAVGWDRYNRLMECIHKCTQIPGWNGANKEYFLTTGGVSNDTTVCVDANMVFSPESCKKVDKVIARQRDPTVYFVRTEGGVDFNAPEDQTGLYGLAEELMISLFLGEVPKMANKRCMHAWLTGNGRSACRAGRGNKDEDFSTCMPFDLKKFVHDTNNDYVKFYIRWRELLKDKCEFVRPLCDQQELRSMFPDFCDVQAMLRVFTVVTAENDESVQFADMQEDVSYAVLQLILVNTEVCLQTKVELHPNRIFECFGEYDIADARHAFTDEDSVCFQFLSKWYDKCCDISNRAIYDAYCVQRTVGSRPRALMENYLDPTREHHILVANRIYTACAENWFVGMSKLSNLAGGAYTDWVSNVQLHAQCRRILHNFGPLLTMITTFANAGNSEERLKFWGILHGTPGSGKSNTIKTAAIIHGGNVFSETDTTEKAKTSHGYATFTNGDINLAQELPAYFQQVEEINEKVLQWQKFCCGEACAFVRSIQDPVTGKQIIDVVSSRMVGGALACTNYWNLPKAIVDRAYHWESSNNPNARTMLHMAADQNVLSDQAFSDWSQSNLDWWGVMVHGYVEYITIGVLPCGVGMPSESPTSDYVRSRQPAKMDMAITFLNDVCDILYRNTGIQMLPLPPRYQDLYVNALYSMLAMASLQHSQGLAGYCRYILDEDIKAECRGSIGTFFMKVKEAYAWELDYTHCVAAIGSLLPGWIRRAAKKGSDAPSSTQLATFVKQDLVLRRIYDKRCDFTPYCLQLDRHTQLVNANGRDVCTKPCAATFGSVNRLVYEHTPQDGTALLFDSDGHASLDFTYHLLLSDMIDTCYCCGKCGKAKSEGPKTFHLNTEWMPQNECIGTCKCALPARPAPLTVTTQVPMSPELQTMLEGMKPGSERIVIASSSWLSGTNGYGSLQPASQQIVYLFVKSVGDMTADDTILLQNLVSQPTHTLRKQKLRNEIPKEQQQCAVDPKGVPKNLLLELRLRRDKGAGTNPAYTKIGGGNASQLADRISKDAEKGGANYDQDSILQQFTAATQTQYNAQGTILGLDGKSPSAGCTTESHSLPSAGLDLCLRQLSVNQAHVNANYGGLISKDKRFVVCNITNGARYIIKEMREDGRFALHAPPMQVTYDTTERGFPLSMGTPKDVLAVFPMDTALESVGGNTIVSYVDHQGTRHDKHVKQCGIKWFQKRLDEYGDQMVSTEMGNRVQDAEKLTPAKLCPLVDINTDDISLQELTDSISGHYNTAHILEIREVTPSHAADAYVSVGGCVLPIITVRDCMQAEWENPTSQPAFVLANDRGMQPSGRKNESIGIFDLYMSTQLMMNMLATRTTDNNVPIERKVFDALQDMVNQLPPQFMVDQDIIGDEQLQKQLFSTALHARDYTDTETNRRQRTVAGQTTFVNTTSRVFVSGGEDLCGADHLVVSVNNPTNDVVLTAHGTDPNCTCQCSSGGEFARDENCPLGFSADVLCPGDQMNLNNFTHGITYDPSKHTARIQSNHHGIPKEFCTNMEAFKVFPQDRTHDASGKKLFPFPLDIATLQQQPTQSTTGASKITPSMGTAWMRDEEGYIRAVTDVSWNSGNTDTAELELINRLHVPCSSHEEAIANKSDINTAAANELAAACKYGGVILAQKMVRNSGDSSRNAHIAAHKDVQIANGCSTSALNSGSAVTDTNNVRKRKLRSLFSSI